MPSTANASGKVSRLHNTASFLASAFNKTRLIQYLNPTFANDRSGQFGDIRVKVVHVVICVFLLARAVGRASPAYQSFTEPLIAVTNQQSAQANRQFIISCFSLLLAQGLTIIVLLLQRASKKKIRTELVLSNDRLRLAMETGKTVGWESDLLTGKAFLFGDLRAMLGTTSDTLTGKVEDLNRYIHPEDRHRVSEAVVAARHDRTLFIQEFRVVWPANGTPRWVAARGKFEYASSGKAIRMFGLAVDVTERRATEEALKRSEEKFSTAFRESPLALTLTSAVDHRYIEVNDAFQKITGWTGDEAVGRTPFDLGIWSDPAQRADLVERLLAGEHIRELEVAFRTKDGKDRAGTGAAVLISINGEPCALSVIADITEIRRAQEQKRVSEDRFRQFFETIPEYCYISSPDGELLDVNPAACQALGYKKEELLGKPLSSIYAPESFAKTSDLLDKWRRSGTLRNEETVILTKEGQRRTVFLNAGSLLDPQGHLRFSTWVLTDITEFKAMQERLREQQIRLNATIESAMDAIITTDESQRIVLFNPAAEKMFHCAAKDAIGTALDRFIRPSFHDEHPSPIREFGKAHVTSRMIGTLPTLWAQRANGERFPIEASNSEADVSGNKLFTVIVRDITERRQAEEALSGVSRRLIEAHEEERAWLARELHDDINQRIALLAASMARLNHFLPVSAVEARNHIEELLNQATSLGTDVQTLSHRLHSSKLEYLGLRMAAAGFCREFSDQHGVKIDFQSDDIPKDLPKEISLCLFRVLQEAIQNAMKHSGSKHFQVKFASSKDDIRLIVADLGRGFDPEQAAKGPGVGITNMKERLKLVRGEFTITSQSEGGAVVRARVPIGIATRSAHAAK